MSDTLLYTPSLKKPRPLQYPGTTSLKRTRGYPRFLAEMIVIHSPLLIVGEKSDTGRESRTCTVSV